MRLVIGLDAKSTLDRLAAIENAATNPRDVFVEIADELFPAWMRRYWATAQWIPLQADSVRRKRRKGRPARPLVGGPLERSLTVRGAPDRVRRINKLSVTVGTRERTAHLHDRGTRGVHQADQGDTRGRGGLPRRPVLSISPANRTEAREAFGRHLVQAGSTHRRRTFL